jgi:glucose dehydrogenase
MLANPAPSEWLAWRRTWDAHGFSPLTGIDGSNARSLRVAWSNRPGVTNDLLYTNTTLAIDPDTGHLAWHYQHHPNELWDLDWAFERQIVRLPVRGELRRVVVTAGKIGIYDAVDGKQYVAVATGRGAFHPNSYAVLVPELGSPEDRTSVIWVFALP